MLRTMKWVLRALLLGTACSLVLAVATDAKKPPLKRACQLATNAEVNAIMGRTLRRTSNEPTGCAWQGGPKAQAALTIYGFKTVAIAKQYLAGKVKGYEFCIDAPDHFLPHSGLGDDAWRDACGSNISFRAGRVVGEFTTFTRDVEEGSAADTRRTAGLTRKAVTHLNKLRCTAFCRLR
jgi:hypothetical protein